MVGEGAVGTSVEAIVDDVVVVVGDELEEGVVVSAIVDVVVVDVDGIIVDAIVAATVLFSNLLADSDVSAELEGLDTAPMNISNASDEAMSFGTSFQVPFCHHRRPIPTGAKSSKARMMNQVFW